jgi:hypothetical protein
MKPNTTLRHEMMPTGFSLYILWLGSLLHKYRSLEAYRSFCEHKVETIVEGWHHVH